MPISRLYVGTSFISSPAMRISPLSGPRNPAARLSSVVLPQPDGPSRVMNSPCRIESDTSFSAVISPNRLVTASNRTAPSFAAIDLNPASVSAALFNIQHLAETEICVGEDNQPGGARNIHDGKRGHRRIGKLPDIIVHRHRQRLRSLRRDEKRCLKLVEGQHGGKQPV